MCINPFIWQICASIRLYGRYERQSVYMADMCVNPFIWQICASIRLYGRYVHQSVYMADMSVNPFIWQICASIRLYGRYVRQSVKNLTCADNILVPLVKHDSSVRFDYQGLYSLTILKNLHSLFLRDFVPLKVIQFLID